MMLLSQRTDRSPISVKKSGELPRLRSVAVTSMVRARAARRPRMENPGRFTARSGRGVAGAMRKGYADEFNRKSQEAVGSRYHGADVHGQVSIMRCGGCIA